MAHGTGLIPTETHFPCRTLVACLAMRGIPVHRQGAGSGLQLLHSALQKGASSSHGPMLLTEKFPCPMHVLACAFDFKAPLASGRVSGSPQRARAQVCVQVSTCQGHVQTSGAAVSGLPRVSGSSTSTVRGDLRRPGRPAVVPLGKALQGLSRLVCGHTPIPSPPLGTPSGPCTLPPPPCKCR